MKKFLSVLLAVLLTVTCLPLSALAAETSSEETGAVLTLDQRIAAGHQVVLFEFPDSVWGDYTKVKWNTKKHTVNVFCNYYAIYGNKNKVATRSWEAPSTAMLADENSSKTFYFDITESGQGEMEEGAEYGILFSTKANAGNANLLQPNTDGFQTCDLYLNTKCLGDTFKVDEPAVVRENTANSQKIDYIAHSSNGISGPLKKVSTLCAYIDGMHPGTTPNAMELANALKTYLPNPVNEPSFTWNKIQPMLEKFNTTAQEVYGCYVEKYGSQIANGTLYEHVDGVDDLKADGTLKDVYRYSYIVTDEGLPTEKIEKFPTFDLVKERLTLSNSEEPISEDPCGHIFTYTIPGKAPTCTEAGLSDSKYCASCGEMIMAQEELPALGHHPIIDHETEATCQHEGHTLGVYCDRCGEVYVPMEIIPKLPHTVVKDEAVAPTCDTAGKTEGSHCSMCGEIIVEQQVIPALGHHYVYVPAKEATYMHTGHTEGVQCDKCEKWLIATEETPLKPVDFMIGDVTGDELLTVEDITAVQRMLSEFLTADLTDEKTFLQYDFNGDGKINIKDVTAMQRKLAELE